MSSNTFAVLDFETSGLSPNQGDRAIEIGIVLIQNNEIIDSYSSLINPHFRISSEIESLTGITNRMLSTAPNASIVMEESHKFIDGLPLVAHNASFDKRFFEYELKQAGLNAQANFICTMLVARRLYPFTKNHKLNTLANLHGISSKGHHRALADAVMTAKLFGNMQGNLSKLHSDTDINQDFLLNYQRTKKSIAKSIKSLKEFKKINNVSSKSPFNKPLMETHPGPYNNYPPEIEYYSYDEHLVEKREDNFINEETSNSSHRGAYQRATMVKAESPPSLLEKVKNILNKVF